MQGIVPVLLLAVYVEAGYNASSLLNKGGSVSETTALSKSYYLIVVANCLDIGSRGWLLLGTTKYCPR